MSLDMEMLRSSAVTASAGPVEREAISPKIDILHLAELVPVVRARFGLDEAFADDAILGSLRVIAGRSPQHERRQAAFGSNLGQTLALGGRDLDTVLDALVATVPGPTS